MTAELHLADFILLRVIVRAPAPPTKWELWRPHKGLWNAALKPFVRSGKCAPVNSDTRFNQSIQKLRDLYLIEQRAPYRATMNGMALAARLTDANCWPLVVPVEGKLILWERAEY